MDKITIKEAGRYANFLERTLDRLTALSYRGLESKIFKSEELHKKSASYKEAEDDTITIEYEDVVDISVEDLTKLILSIVKEKATLADMIAEAKKGISIEVDDISMNLDSSIEYAKVLRKVSDNYFKNLSRMKDSKRKEQERGYAFNVEGNQTGYFYEKEITTTLQFDKTEIIEKDKEQRMLADKLSEKIEQSMSQPLVEFEPTYSYLDTFEEVIKKYLEE